VDATGWSSGGGTFGVRVGARNRDRHFERSWSEIEVEIDGDVHTFPLTPGFWNRCPEFRDSGGDAIRSWLRRHRSLKWPKGHPPRFGLLPLGAGRFRLVP
jgi:hypothetical protein